MEFREMLKAGLSEVPGTGFTHMMKQNVLDTVRETHPRRVHPARLWSFLTAVAAVCVVVGAGWAVHENQTGKIIATTDHANKPAANLANTATGPSRVSVTAGIGDTLDVFTQEYGTPTQISRPPAASPAEYDFPKNISAWVEGGRVVEIHRTFSGGQMHTTMQVVFAMTPRDSVLQEDRPLNQANTEVFTYQSATLARALPGAAFGKAKPGVYRVVITHHSSSVDATVVLGDVAAQPFLQHSSGRALQTTLTYQSEGSNVSDPASLWNSPQGYSLYVSNRFTASAEEPNSDIVWLNTNHNFTMRIQALSPTANVDDVVNSAEHELTALGTLTIVPAVKVFPDPLFQSAAFVGYATTPSQQIQIMVIRVSGGLFEFTITMPKQAESLNPLYAMIKTIDMPY